MQLLHQNLVGSKQFITKYFTKILNFLVLPFINYLNSVNLILQVIKKKVI